MNSSYIQLEEPINGIDNRKSKPQLWEYLVPILITISLLTACIIASPKKYFWNDELYSYYLLSESSFSHMWGSFNDKINNTPPLYFILGWLWAKLFSPSELSLRLFSSIGLALSCYIIWTTLRRTYSFVAASIGVLLPFCTSTLVLYQNTEARMYGLYMIVAAVGFFLYDTINRREKPGTPLLVANALIHAAFIQTHLHGLFFSGAILVSFIATDWYVNRFRPAIYISIVVGWLSFLLYLPAFLIQVDAGTPRTWIYLPSLRDLADTLTLVEYGSMQWDRLLPITKRTWLRLAILLAILAVPAWVFVRSLAKISRSEMNRGNNRQQISTMVLAYAFLAVPVFVWCISYLIKPVFMDRYLMPVLISWTIILAQLVTYSGQFVRQSGLLATGRLSPSRWSLVGGVLFIGIAVYALAAPIKNAVARHQEQLPGLTDTRYGYESLPVVVTFSNDFLKRLYYSPNRDRYRFIQDLPSALDEGSGLFPPQEYKHLDALKRRYPDYFKNQIIQSADFLKTTKRFLVLNSKNYARKISTEPLPGNLQQPQWFIKVIQNNPAYKVTELGEIDDYWKVHLVEAR
ncbi:glycosyltransferase family 39 protein [Spirosoma aerophilum]